MFRPLFHLQEKRKESVGLITVNAEKYISLMKRDPHDPILIGDYLADMAVAYFPRKELEKFLPRAMSIPSDKVMAEKYPTVMKMEGMHPFMLQSATGNNVRPLMENHESPSYPSYREIMFYFPVIYTHKKEEHLCSYVPVLYLDYFFGVIIGNLFWGFRKEYHPEMIIEETDTSNKCTVKDVICASFHQTSTDSRQELDPFFVQTFENPTVTVSYLHQTYFYNTRVFSLTKMIHTSPVYEWNYKGSVIKNNPNTFGSYSEFTFTISKSMRYKAYFHPTD
jgi:hypothetical protein